MGILQKQVKALKKIFLTRRLLKIATKVKFIKRLRQITPRSFIKSILAASSGECSSLEFLVGSLYDDKINVSKQSLHEKINDQAVEFVKELFHSVSEHFMKSRLIGGSLTGFTDIKLVDSSEIGLNKILNAIFNGTQNAARCKVQAILGLLSNCIECEVTKGNKNDQGYRDYLKNIAKGNLVMFDLGYFVTESFEEIKAKSAFFISKLLRGTIVSGNKTEPIKINELLKETKKDTIDMQVLIGKKQLKCRLVGCKLTGEALKKRQEKFERTKRRNSRQARQGLEEIDCWSLYITNVKKTIPINEIHNLYRLRWQVELLFKVMKSKLSMDAIKDRNKNKALLMIYGKLILLTLALIFLESYRNTEISLYKAIDYYKEKFEVILDGIITGKWYKIKKILKKIEKFAKKSSRKNRPSTKQLCGLGPSFSSA
jgi:hypothetical protein